MQLFKLLVGKNGIRIRLQIKVPIRDF
jgi:hypothetical protein